MMKNRQETSASYLVKLQELGYLVHTPIEDLWDKIKKFDVTNTACGHRFQSQGGNILNGMSRCGVCGPTNRVTAALSAYKRRYGRTYDMTNRDDYYRVVRQLSTKNFIEKSTRDQHLDHIISIDWGFKNAAPPEMIADATNLRILAAKENIAKGSLISDFDLLKSLCEKYNHPFALTLNSESLDHKIYGLLLKRVPSLFSAIDMQGGILHCPGLQVQVINVAAPTTPKEDCIVLFSDEIEYASNSDRRLRIIVERLLHKTGQHTERIAARKCTVEKLDTVTASRFLDSYHFQGRGSSRLKFGLYYRDELVAVMTFGKPRFAKGYDWELIRYATKGGITVVGGASRLLAHFRKHFSGSIITYSDRRWGNGQVYSAIGFKKISTSKPNYWWVREGRRITRYQSQLNLLPELLGPSYDPALSEAANMTAAGWVRIQDLGNDVFAMK